MRVDLPVTDLIEKLSEVGVGSRFCRQPPAHFILDA